MDKELTETCEKWMNVWSYNQVDYRSWPSTIGNHIQRLNVRSNHSASQVRIRYSNRYGVVPLYLDAVTIRINHGKEYTLTCGGRPGAQMLPGGECCSDEIAVVIAPGDEIEIISHMKQQTSLTGGIVTYSRQELGIANFDAAGGEQIPQKMLFAMVKDNPRMSFVYGIGGIELYVPETSRCVVAFGDSLTQQGFWVDHLKRRLRMEGHGQVAVLNRGIGGSRVLKGTAPQVDRYDRHGRSGLERFYEECFGTGKPDAILVFHGINDLITRHTPEPDDTYDVEDIAAGLENYAKTAHRCQTNIWIATLAPLKHSIFYSDALEQERCRLNKWIRSQQCYDGVVDFEAAVCDANDNAALAQSCDSGDGLHWSDEGGRAAAGAIETEKLLRWGRDCDAN